jgi:hypothetical protein
MLTNGETAAKQPVLPMDATKMKSVLVVGPTSDDIRSDRQSTTDSFISQISCCPDSILFSQAFLALIVVFPEPSLLDG